MGSYIESTGLLVNRRLGISFSFFSLLLLGIMPIISNGRPGSLGALEFAIYLSIWELISSIPVLVMELRGNTRGVFDPHVNPGIRKHTMRIMFLTGLIFSVTTFLYVLSLEKAGTVNAAIALQAYPLFSILIETLFLGRGKSAKELVFTLLLVTGLYYLGTGGSFALQDLSVWFILALLVPLLWALAHITIRQTLANSPITPNQITFLRVLISSIVLFFISILTGDVDAVIAGFINPRYQLFGFLMGIVYYMELVSWFHAIRYIDVSLASSITTPSPVLTLIFAVILLRERIFGFQIITMLVVFVALYGLLYLGKEEETKPT